MLYKSNLFDNNKEINIDMKSLLPSKILCIRCEDLYNNLINAIKIKNKLYCNNNVIDANSIEYEVRGEVNFRECVEKFPICDEVKDLWGCVLEFYREIAINLHNQLEKEIQCIDSNSEQGRILNRFNLPGLFNFLIQLKFNNLPLDVYLSRGLTCLKYVMKFYRDNFNPDFKFEYYVNPFELLYKRFGENKHLVDSFNSFTLMKNTTDKFDSIALVYDLLNDVIGIKMYDYEDYDLWTELNSLGKSKILYTLIGFISVKDALNEYINGNSFYDKFIKEFFRLITKGSKNYLQVHRDRRYTILFYLFSYNVSENDFYDCPKDFEILKRFQAVVGNWGDKNHVINRRAIIDAFERLILDSDNVISILREPKDEDFIAHMLFSFLGCLH